MVSIKCHIIARFCPLLLSGNEEELVNLLKDNNDMIKEGVLNVLAKAGGTIREQLAVTSSSVDLILDKLCLEGSLRQAKYALHALVAITKDDGLKSLSVLYKKLVDMLEEKTHMLVVLQSLGYIAQNAMPVFETRESDIEEFITNKILKSDSKEEDHTRTSWDDKSDICMLKLQRSFWNSLKVHCWQLWKLLLLVHFLGLLPSATN